jgi:phenylalanyl-tRNA synthetase alpha chain
MEDSGLKDIVVQLSEIERKTLATLNNKGKSEKEIAKEANINTDSARRAINWLAQKKLAQINEKKIKKTIITKEGQKALEEGLPETKMLKTLENYKELTFKELMKKANLTEQEFSVALGINKKKAFIIICKEGNETKIKTTEVAKEFSTKKTEEEKCLQEIATTEKTNDMETLKQLCARGLAEEKEEIERQATITQKGEEALKMKEFYEERKYNIQDPVPELFIGKKQPYIQFLNIIRRKLTELGFKEMDSPLIVHEFYNFDVLFQPQNHPARTWTDTYQLKNPKIGKLTNRKAVQAVKAAHENGGVSDSKGWRYNWSEEIASKIMPTAHGTAHSARQLTKGVEMPGKYFAIARCFRPDVLDATHLIEFNQTEGFIVGEELNFRHLLGMLEQFATEIAGAKQVKFIPDYYPFTEPSVQLSAKHPSLGWVELGGAGMFRPEILTNLGIKGQAIAWGIGIDRLAMFKLGIKDIRYLFSDDLNWLRKTPMLIE